MLKATYTNLVNTVSDKLYRYILSQGVETSEAKDVMQNCFEALWKSKVEEIGEGERYLFGVAYKQCAEYWRQKHKKGKLDIEIEHMVSFDSNMSQNIISRALSILTEQQKSLVILKDVQGYSYEEIATITDLNASQVKVYLHRARLALKNFIVKLENVI